MSHVPLLSKQSVPKLQSPRRGPQVVCLCLLLGVVFLLVPSRVYAPLMSNATRARADPPPPALRRIIDASTQHQLVTGDTLQDLLTAVGFLAEREIAKR
ncbi:MAG: hypothetical protein CMI29_06680 [Opitutae bacterium]|nr:hypothetical protein [Opitutae bacterium]|tara:strand:+ start:1277 stop:1573 length:297 start_codon:yes stop_codon:yes gene_type:complete